LNRNDIFNRRGLILNGGRFPRILGADGAGIVAAVGKQVKNIAPGEAVCFYPVTGCGTCELCNTDREFMCAGMSALGESEDGTYAEFIRVPARNCFSVPRGLSLEEAAALPSAYLSAWRMLVTNAQIMPGERLLIRGIGGGVATAALQIAAAVGARIIVTSHSDDKLARAMALGAEQGINYTKGDFAKEARRLTDKRGVDVVVDCVGGDGWIKSIACLCKGGRLVTCGATDTTTARTDVQRIFWNDLNIFGSTFGARQEFWQVLNLVRVSGAKPVVDKIFPLHDAAAAQQRMENSEHFGKIVLRMN
jgi:NADPH:quinone reductase-like Zn-dependent oxidoreductase